MIRLPYSAPHGSPSRTYAREINPHHRMYGWHQRISRFGNDFGPEQGRQAGRRRHDRPADASPVIPRTQPLRFLRRYPRLSARATGRRCAIPSASRRRSRTSTSRFASRTRPSAICAGRCASSSTTTASTTSRATDRGCAGMPPSRTSSTPRSHPTRRLR